MTSIIPNDVINWDILNEIISMDEDDPDFSKELIRQFIEQAKQTFDQIQDLLQQCASSSDTRSLLQEISNLGHFLKGSSSALGLTRIAWYCECIQNYGNLKNYGGSHTIRQDNGPNNNNNNIPAFIKLLKNALKNARIEFELARSELSKYYKEEL
ncbi:related to Phosphorelay intermediate protein YPD1 [Saccharomycodes ludwigii]|uniref:Related to Phosphorelay intermediate protein YPD1 n=1 Tax=Saccharomycodes ludwigii TaxID=36035 RepID=A0A376B586_9ASCO|nr:hypothetical protein SCDLUD_003018 [Saccharomycodes ludwigii]KAH3901522.1 hypothetical protein SCDLUD_003018 [Saccharomycodes ludwigii]SSD59782.1 related to Phosphorelay intermediate protein YPD1 [Saccharomycodes ludwigii]